MGRKTKWTKEKVQEESNKVHGNNFIIHGLLSGKELNLKSRAKHADIKCIICDYRYFVEIHSHIKRNKGCPQCNNRIPLTLDKIQECSNNIHNNKFIILNTKIKKIKTKT